MYLEIQGDFYNFSFIECVKFDTTEEDEISCAIFMSDKVPHTYYLTKEEADKIHSQL